VENEIAQLTQDLENSTRMAEDYTQHLSELTAKGKELAQQVSNLQSTQFELKVKQLRLYIIHMLTPNHMNFTGPKAAEARGSKRDTEEHSKPGRCEKPAAGYVEEG